MKVRLGVIAVAVALLVPATASGWTEKPAIGESFAQSAVSKYLRKYPGWRYRQDGFVDCRRGRINGYTWACRVAWWSGYRCRQGRVRITTRYGENGTIYYYVHAYLVRC